MLVCVRQPLSCILTAHLPLVSVSTAKGQQPRASCLASFWEQVLAVTCSKGGPQAQYAGHMSKGMCLRQQQQRQQQPAVSCSLATVCWNARVRVWHAASCAGSLTDLAPVS